MSEYTFVHLLDKKPVGSELGRSMPLHMTILHWFESNSEQATIIAETQVALRAATRIVTRATDRALFGPNNDIPVTRVNKTAELTDLHADLLTSMQGLRAAFNMNWSGADNWNPHISDKPDMSISVGDEVVIDDIDLAFRSEKYGVRTLLHRFDLTGELQA